MRQGAAHREIQQDALGRTAKRLLRVYGCQKQRNAQKNKDAAMTLGLSAYTPRQLMEELARRGYEGKLTYTKIVTIDITNF